MVPSEFVPLFAEHIASIVSPSTIRLTHAGRGPLNDGGMISIGFTQWADERVRLLGVNTPEARGPESPGGKFVSKELSRFLPTGPEDGYSFRPDHYGRSLVVMSGFSKWASPGRAI